MARIDDAKEYVRNNVMLISKDSSLDDKFGRLHTIYNHLEYMGYSTHEAKIIVDSIIMERMEKCAEKLDKIMKGFGDGREG